MTWRAGGRPRRRTRRTWRGGTRTWRAVARAGGRAGYAGEVSLTGESDRLQAARASVCEASRSRTRGRGHGSSTNKKRRSVQAFPNACCVQKFLLENYVQNFLSNAGMRFSRPRSCGQGIL